MANKKTNKKTIFPNKRGHKADVDKAIEIARELSVIKEKEEKNNLPQCLEPQKS